MSRLSSANSLCANGICRNLVDLKPDGTSYTASSHNCLGSIYRPLQLGHTCQNTTLNKGAMFIHKTARIAEKSGIRDGGLFEPIDVHRDPQVPRLVLYQELRS